MTSSSTVTTTTTTSTTTFTPEELERLDQHFARTSKHGVARHNHIKNQLVPTNFHTRGYDKGDLRCVRCRKWLNPNDPEEDKQIRYGKGGKRHHLNCPVYALYPATLAMFSRQGSYGRNKRDETTKRY